MSELCLINLKKHKLKYEQLNDMAKEIVKFALTMDKGVYFNSLSYSNKLILEANVRDYFLLTDCFYCDNCEFVSTIGLIDSNLEKFEQNFMNKFKFFKELLLIIFSFDVSEIEVFLSEDDSDNLQDYDEVVTNPQDFLHEIFNNILKYKEEMAYGIPNLKLVVKK